MLQHGASRDNHIADCTFAHFEIDGSSVILPVYDVLDKGLDMQYVLRGRFHDLYIHDSPATGFGCGFLQDTFLDNLLIVHCGRLENGEWIGGAGIGIGVGGWGPVERCTVTACTTIRNGTNGIFFELQKRVWTRPPASASSAATPRPTGSASPTGSEDSDVTKCGWSMTR